MYFEFKKKKAIHVYIAVNRKPEQNIQVNKTKFLLYFIKQNMSKNSSTCTNILHKSSHVI